MSPSSIAYSTPVILVVQLQKAVLRFFSLTIVAFRLQATKQHLIAMLPLKILPEAQSAPHL